MKTLHPGTGKAKAFAGVVVALVAVLAVLAVGGGPFLVARAQEARAPQVLLVTATTDSIVNSVLAAGDIEASDRSTIALVPSVRVTDVLVQEGQLVRRGDVLVVLDASEHEKQRVQQDITLADLQVTLARLSGTAADEVAALNAAAWNAVEQARQVLDHARATESAAGQHLADVSARGATALRQADATLDGAEQAETEARAQAQAVREFHEEAVEQAVVALDTAQLAHDQAEQDVAALEEHLSEGLITQAEYDAQRSTLTYARDDARNALSNARTTLDTVRVTAEEAVGSAEQAASEASRAVTDAEAARDSLVLATAAEVRHAGQALAAALSAVRSAEIDLSTAKDAAGPTRTSISEMISHQRNQIALVEANIGQLQDKVEQGRLRAAIDGVVTRVDAVAGQYPSPGGTVVVEGTSGYVARVELSRGDVVDVRPGQEATVTIKDTGITYQGSVTAIAPVAAPSATSPEGDRNDGDHTDGDSRVEVEVGILDPDTTIRVGFEADVDILLDHGPDALQIAAGALQSDPGTGRTYVWAVDDRNRVGKVFVETGVESGDRVEVLSGLADGQDCVVDPPDALTEGALVRIAGGNL